MAIKTETFPLEVTGCTSGQIASRISRDIDQKRKKGLKFIGGIPVDWLMFDSTKTMQIIMMSYEGENG